MKSNDGESHLAATSSYEWLLAFGIYLFVSLTFFGRGLIGHSSDYYIGRTTDPSIFMWSLAWPRYALSHHSNLLFSRIIFAPFGINLTWVTCVPLLGILAAPMEAVLGPVATYNIIVLLMPPVAAVCTFALCSRFTGRFLPSLVGGLVFGFSAYMLGQVLAHLHLLPLFPIPILAYLAVRRFDETFSIPRFVGLFTLTLVSEFLCSLELFATTALIASIAIATSLLLTSSQERRRVFGLIVPISASYAIAIILVSPYIYSFLRPGFPSHPFWDPGHFPADVLNLFVPTSTNLLGENSFASSLSSRFLGNLFERGAYIGPPLILITFLWGRMHWNETLARVLIFTLMAICILAFGPRLQIGGFRLLPMPWQVFARLPLIKGAMPVRIMAYASLIVALIAALWLSDPAVSRRAKLAGAIAILVFMLPNVSASYWVTATRTPAFFLDGSSQRMLSPRDIVVPLPFGGAGMSLLWQAQSGMNFRMASGLLAPKIVQVQRWPAVNAFEGSPDLPEPATQLKAFVANIGVTAIVMDDADPGTSQWMKLLSLLDIKPEKRSGVSLFRISPRAFTGYRSMTAIQMETRAARLRFETLLSASAKYVAGGGQPDNLTMLRLYDAGLLPRDWKLDPDFLANDAWTGSWEKRLADPWEKNLIGIAISGTPSALSPVVNDYLPDAEFAFFPYPALIKDKHRGLISKLLLAIFRAVTHDVISQSTSGEGIHRLVMVFKASKLQGIAHRVAADLNFTATSSSHRS